MFELELLKLNFRNEMNNLKWIMVIDIKIYDYRRLKHELKKDLILIFIKLLEGPGRTFASKGSVSSLETAD